MVRRQEGVVDDVLPIQLVVQFQHALTRLGHLQEDLLVLLGLVDALHRAGQLVARAALAAEAGGHAEALPVQHDHGLPVVELEEARVEGDAGRALRRRALLPLPQPAVDVAPPGREVGVAVQEGAGQARVHVGIGAVAARGPHLARLAVLQHLQDLRLQQAQAPVVLGHALVARLALRVGRRADAGRGDVAVVEQRGELGRDDLVRHAERPPHARADQPVERVDAPPEPPPQVAHPLAPAALPRVDGGRRLAGVAGARGGGFERNVPAARDAGAGGLVDANTVLVVQAEIDGEAHGYAHDVPQARRHGPQQREAGEQQHGL